MTSGFAGFRAADCLSLAAAPTFAVMAALSAGLGGTAPDMMCAAASPMSAMSGMVPMYVLMSAFHVGPWLKLIARWRGGATRGRPAVAEASSTG